MSLTLSRAGIRNPNPQTQPNDGAPSAGESRPQADNNLDITAELDKEELLKRFIEWFQTSRDHYQPWRMEAIDCYDFVASNQWDEDDLKILRDQGRPAVTFNRIGPFVDGVSGLEIGNRQTTSYLPRQIGKSGVNELLTGAVQWARDECDAEDEESEAVRDNIICGTGWTETYMSYDVDPDGVIKIDRVDPLEMYPDPASRKSNYADGRFVIRVKDIPVGTAEEMYPEIPTLDLHAQWAEDQPDDTKQPHNARMAPYYRIDQSGDIDRERQQVRMAEVEWWDYVTAYRVLDTTTGRFVRLSEDDFAKYRFRARVLGIKVEFMKDRERKYYKAIVGNVVIKVIRGPDVGGFQYKAMTGKRDRNRGFWYGLVAAMRDPQLWANKFFTQALHIVNVNAKGGLLAETDAFVDIEEARNDWANADSITELNPGGLQKVEQKNPPAFPMQINQMMEMAISAIPATAGVNLEMIAQQTKDQPGVLEMQRKQQGMTVLAFIFDAKRRYQKEQGRLMLWVIQTFIADGRLIRIGGPEEAQYVPLIHDPGIAEYDVIVDDSPTSPNMKERVWAMIMQMFPMLKTFALPPQAMAELMRYSPFPASLVQKISEMTSQPPPPTPDAQAKIDLDKAKAQELGARAIKTQAEAQNAPQKAQLEAASIQYDHQKLALESEKLKADTEKARAEALNSLQDAGILQNDQHFQQMMTAVDALQTGQDADHSRQMDHAKFALDVHQQKHGQALAAQQQQHDQALGVAQHALASQQASQQAEQAEASHGLAVYQAKHPPKPAGGAKR